MRAWIGIVVAGGIALGLSVAADPAEAVIADCTKGQKITPKLRPKAVVVVKGACTENVVLSADDVTITTDGITPASITGADPAQPTILLEGARRATIDGIVANGLVINGGAFGVAARTGATLELRNCQVTGATNTGVVASYGSTVEVDACQLTGNPGNGGVAANVSSLVITNSLVDANGGTGLTAVRNSYLRVGQDSAGTATVKAVTVSGNGANGITVSESSSANVVGGTVESSGGTNIFVGRGSSGQIGLGSSLAAGVLVQNGAGHGISVEGANATIVHSTISGHALTGIIISNAGSARIGILNGSTGYGPTTVSGNGATGVQVSDGSSAFIGGTTISGNGPGAAGFGGFGLLVFQASAELAGNNVIENNAETGIFVGGGAALVGQAAFGLGTTNAISGNGTTGPNRGGVFAYRNGSIILDGATTISNNVGTAVTAFEGGVIEMRGSAAVTVPAAGTTHGASVEFGSTLRVRDSASIVSATGDGIQATNQSTVVVRDATSVVQGNGPTGVGVRCVSRSPLTVSAATLTGTLTGVSGTAAAHDGCNVFP